MNEEKLIKKAKNGDEAAFGDLYHKYIKQIYRFIYLRVKSKEDAEDITHHVFLSAWKKIPDYEFKGFPFSSWLYRIASNAVIDHYRTSRQHQDIETVPESFLSDNPLLGEKMDISSEFTMVKQAIAKLESDQQNVMLLKFVNELSNKEIADSLGKTEGAIRVIQHRAIKKIKKHVEEQENKRRVREA